jgi:hypothetical protein
MLFLANSTVYAASAAADHGDERKLKPKKKLKQNQEDKPTQKKTTKVKTRNIKTRNVKTRNVKTNTIVLK